MPAELDLAAEAFATTMTNVANWKHNYFGASYRTRLFHAIDDARGACDRLDQFLRQEPRVTASNINSGE